MQQNSKFVYEFKIHREFSNFFVIISMKWTKSERNHEATEYRYININEVTTSPFLKDSTSTRYNSNISRHDFFLFCIQQSEYAVLHEICVSWTYDITNPLSPFTLSSR